METSFADSLSYEQVAVERSENDSNDLSLDRTLTEIRTGRRLEKIVVSVESFLNSQVARLEKAIDECNRAEKNDKIVQRIMAEFESDKLKWEEDRQREILRLQTAGEELIKGWEKLENERRK